VSDTSVLIDLERGSLLQATFQLPTPLAVPDLLYERELAPTNGEFLLSLGLQKLPLDPTGTALAQTYRTRVRALSLPDAFALALAKQGGHILVCGDRRLRELSEAEDVTCHGVLWLLDQILDAGGRTKSELAEALKVIAAHSRCRLPRALVAEHLTRYSKK
jgi:hypothetical protein